MAGLRHSGKTEFDPNATIGLILPMTKNGK
jgi:hypothetical protein